MEWYFILAILIGGLVVFMLLGLPVVFAFFTVNIVKNSFRHDRSLLCLSDLHGCSVKISAILCRSIYLMCTGLMKKVD